MVILWFLLGVMATVATEFAALMGAVRTVQADVGAAETSFEQVLSEVGGRLDQIIANLPF